METKGEDQTERFRWELRGVGIVAVVAAVICVRRSWGDPVLGGVGFGDFYSAVVTLGCWTSLGLYFLRGERAFVLSGSGSQLLSVFGSALFLAEMASSPMFVIRSSIPSIFWNIGTLAFSALLLRSLTSHLSIAPPMTGSAAGEGKSEGKKNDDGESDVDKEE